MCTVYSISVQLACFTGMKYYEMCRSKMCFCADELSRKQSDSFREMHDVLTSYRGIHLDAKEASCLKALAVFNSGIIIRL